MNWKDAVQGAQPVTLEDILQARDRRAETQQALLDAYQKPLVSFTLNIPGQYKAFPLAAAAFAEGSALLASLLPGAGGTILRVHTTDAATGPEAVYVVEGEAPVLKRMLVGAEQGHPLGRLFDFDVLCADGTPLCGAAFGRAQRTCIVCGAPVWGCARSRAHAPEEVLARVVELLARYFEEKYAADTASKAVRALLAEACAAPKPGLVDRLDSGAHRDMDLFTFVDSGCALHGYFRDVTCLGMGFPGRAEELLEAARFRGILAESEMLAATGGVNTHKGAVFTLGILCLALGRLRRDRQPVTAAALARQCARIAQAAPAELSENPPATHGLRAYHAHGLAGIRGEAAAGFPHVMDCALPALTGCLAGGDTPENAYIVALLHLLARVDDTNMAARGGMEALRAFQDEVRCVLQSAPDTAALLRYAAALNERFIALGLSPGGCADLLAAAIFVHSVVEA